MTSPIRIAAALLAAAALAGCVTPQNFDPSAPDENRTRQGAITGAVTGAIAGLIQAEDGDSRRDALIGAVVGAGAGALVGRQMDQQEAELRAQLGGDVLITRQGNELTLRMPQDILFAVDSATLRPDLQGDLRKLADNLNRFPDTSATVIGHTDNTGDAGYNQNLSQRRAASVAGILTTSGVAPSRVLAFGRGESQPIADNLSTEGRRQNRRVEIVIRPAAA